MRSLNALTKNQETKFSLQYVTNQKGEKIAVILPIEEFEELLMDIEDLKDIYERKNEDLTNHEDFIKELKDNLEISAQLYAEIYEEDEDLQELTSVSCIDFKE